VILTHKPEARNPEELRRDIASRCRISASEFSVMKKQADDLEVAAALSAAIRTVFTHRF
jgi:hypothetical protein